MDLQWACRIRAIPAEILLDCASLTMLSVHSNPVTENQLQATEGFQSYEEPRLKHANKQVPRLPPRSDGQGDTLIC